MTFKELRSALLRLAPLHRFLARTGFYPLFLATSVAFAFMLTRIALTRTGYYRFLVWNLFLAWVPYWCTQAIVYLRERRPLRRRLVWTFGIAWLLFFPNAPYIATDFKHFLYTPKLTWWFDAGLILSFVLAGCFLAVVSLRLMQQIVRRAHGEIAGWVFALGVILL